MMGEPELEDAAADLTELERLRADSRQRLAAEFQNPKARQRRRENVRRAYRETLAEMEELMADPSSDESELTEVQRIRVQSHKNRAREAQDPRIRQRRRENARRAYLEQLDDE